MSNTVIRANLATRAVLRRVEPGTLCLCVTCEEVVKFAAKSTAQQVIANVYVGPKWDRVEHYHADCYETAGNPYGLPA